MTETAKKPLILIIDDETGPRESLRMILKYDYEIVLATGGLDGLTKFSERQYDLVMTDIKMPDISGLEVLREIRNINKTVPVIMITGYATEDVGEEAKRLGICDYIKKPYDVTYILQTVKKTISNPQFITRIP